ncbi:MAG: hypothetical protein R3B84_14835 [Zavarzinella sp.]
MYRWCSLILFCSAASLSAGQFEHYTQSVLANGVSKGLLKSVPKIVLDDLSDYAGVLPDQTATMLVVVTNDGRYSKLLVRPARQKFGMKGPYAMLLIDEYITYKGNTERAFQVKDAGVQLYPGLRISLDVGQIVPESIGGDLQLTAPQAPAESELVPVGGAKLYILEKVIPGIQPKKGEKFTPGEVLQAHHLNGRYKLEDDGRRTGELILQVSEVGDIRGSFTSEKDGREYEVEGKVGIQKHSFTFNIKFPATTQQFTGHIFTGDAKKLAGTTKLLERDAAFVAERIEEK